MKAILILILTNLRLAYRVRIAFFFNFVFPVLITFAYCEIFAGGTPLTVARMMGPLISLTIMTNALLLSGMRSAEMRERGTLRQYHLTPISALQMVLSDMMLGYLTFLPVLAAEIGIALWVYHVTFSGSYLSMFVVCSLGYFTLSALGELLSNLVNTVQEASVVTQLSFFILIFLSGTTMPLDGLPELLQRIALFTPPTLMIVAIQGVMRGDSLVRHLVELAALFSCCVTALIIAVLLFRWDKAEKVAHRKRVQAMLAVVPLFVAGIVLNGGGHMRQKIPDAQIVATPAKPA